jgi:ATP-binding cassette subfamily B multidrug efflux pump
VKTEQKRFAGMDIRLLKRFLPYLKKSTWLAFFSFALMILTNLAGILQPYFVKVGIDNDIARGDWPGLLNTVLLLGMVMVCGFIFQFLYNISIQLLGQRLLYDIRVDLLKKIFSFSHDYFDRTPVGKTLTNVTNDVESVRQFISEGVVTVLGEMLKVVFIFAAMLLVNIRLAVLAFLTIPLFVAATLFFRKSIRSGYADVRRANARINTLLTESISGINEINIFNYQATSKELFTRANRKYLDAFLQVVHSYSLYFPVIELVTNAGMVLVLLYAHYQMGVSILVGEIFIFFAYIQMFFRPLRQLAEKFNLFQSAMAAAERIFGLMDLKSDLTESYGHVPVPVDVKGNIVFSSVNFGYQDDQPVLKNISFSIREGEKVALVGTTGSGKTTVIKLLNRLYEVTSGSITINGRDIRQYPLAVLRKTITTVPQDVFLFTGSAADNISLYDPAISRENVIHAAEQVRADTFIRELPRGYDENLLEEGRSLSSGQKQLISFARAFVRDAHIIVLDEVTANIDSGTESLIQEATRNLIANKTAIIIAHRMSTIKLVDRILVFHRGELVGQGSHSQLMKENGIYAQYYRMQSMLSR